jgi:type III secretory pathway component EscS
MLSSLPLILAPLIVYDLVAAGLLGPTPGDPWVQPVFTVTMVSDGRFTLLTGDLLIAAAVICLFVDVLQATRRGRTRTLDHAVSALIFVVCLGEFLMLTAAATSVFFLLTVIAALDPIAGGLAGRHTGGGFDRDD